MTEPDARHVIAAQGWLELGLVDDAFAELEGIAPESRMHPDVLLTRCSAFIAADKWKEAEEVASSLTHIASARFDGWWMRSFALHELNRTQEAYDNLAAVAEQFKTEWIVHYNLACYLAQLNRIEEARVAIKRALRMNPRQRQDALADSDLEPLWAEIRRAN